MWGVSGQVILGVHMTINMEQHVHTLENLYNMSTAEDIVYMEGKSTGLTLWFSGTRQARNFVAHCCSDGHPLRSIRLEVLPPQGQYIVLHVKLKASMFSVCKL